MEQFEFTKYGKTPRLHGGKVAVTEKLDGSNGTIIINHDGTWQAGSRNRLLTGPGAEDNMGFWSWVNDNISIIAPSLGAGIHRGEWVGPGVQSNPYELEEKKFALFDTNKIGAIQTEAHNIGLTVVPLLYFGPLKSDTVDMCLDFIADGSMFTDVKFSEGVIVYNTALRQPFKVTWAMDGDDYAERKGG